MSHRDAWLMAEATAEERSVSAWLDRTEFPHLHSNHTLHFVLDRMSATCLDFLPVVSRANVHQLEGVVSLRDGLNSYGFDSLDWLRQQE